MNLASHPRLDVVPDYARAICESLIRIESKLENLSSPTESPLTGKGFNESEGSCRISWDREEQAVP
jgi:hypothetical protein